MSCHQINTMPSATIMVTRLWQYFQMSHIAWHRYYVTAIKQTMFERGQKVSNPLISLLLAGSLPHGDDNNVLHVSNGAPSELPQVPQPAGVKAIHQSSSSTARLLHSPNLAALALSVGYETWTPIGWQHPFDLLVEILVGIAAVAMSCGLMWLVGIPTSYQGHWQSPCIALTAGECLPLGLCKETVKASTAQAVESTICHPLRMMFEYWLTVY